MAHIKWIKNILTGRSENAIINRESASGRLVSSRFPRDLVLGFILFNTFIIIMKRTPLIRSNTNHSVNWAQINNMCFSTCMYEVKHRGGGLYPENP